jgi:hypothetical protein
MSEDKIHYNLSQVSDTEAIRKRNWAIAMAGSYVMVFGMDIVNTPVGQLHDCRRLQDFFESTNFNTMAPNDKLKYMGTQYVLASSGESYIAYSSSQPNKMGLRDMVEGRYTFSWLDCVSGKTLKVKNVAVKSGNQSWNVPAGFQREVALYVTRVDEKDQYVLLSRPLNERNINKKIKEEKSDKLRNTIPKATDKSVSIVKNNSIDIQLSYLDLDGGPGPYTTVLLTPPVNGVLSGVGNDLTYTPVKEFVGIDRFTWKVNDGLDDSKPAVVTITINK